jgi:glycosyltransferase involved in cell wall biosynthesis
MRYSENVTIKELNILVIFNTWLNIGGGGIHTMKIAEALGKSHDIQFLIPKLGLDLAKDYLKTMPRCTVCDYSTIFENNPKRNVYLIYLFRMMKSVLLAMKSKTHYNLIISNSQLPFDLIPAIFFKFKNKSRLVVYFHHGNPCIKKELTVRNLISRLNFRLSVLLSKNFADLIFAINEPIKNQMVDWGIRGEKIILTDNGIDYGKIQNIDSNGTEYEGVFLGRVDKIKGAYDLLALWKIVVKKYPTAKLCIIGDGPDRRPLERKIKEDNLDKNIILVGKVDEEEKYVLMKKSKIFVYPSYQESWGIVIAEAMACGLPVVTYDLPVYKGIYKNYIFAVELWSIKKMAEIILNIYKDSEGYKKMVDEAKDYVCKYDWATIQRHELRHIKKIVND